MPTNDPRTPDFDWRITSFEGARREQLRRWAQLPLEKMLLAIEEMQDIAGWFGTERTAAPDRPMQQIDAKEPPAD